MKAERCECGMEMSVVERAEDALELLATVEREWKEMPGVNSGLLYRIREVLGMKPDAVTGQPTFHAIDSQASDEGHQP